MSVLATFSPMTIFLLITLAAIVMASFLTLFLAVRHAPDGEETELGFIEAPIRRAEFLASSRSASRSVPISSALPRASH